MNESFAFELIQSGNCFQFLTKPAFHGTLNVFLRNAAWSTHAAAPGGYSAYEGISPSRSPGNLPFHKWF